MIATIALIMIVTTEEELNNRRMTHDEIVVSGDKATLMLKVGTNNNPIAEQLINTPAHPQYLVHEGGPLSLILFYILHYTTAQNIDVC